MAGDVKIGLIARCERARGLAIQARNLYANIPIDRVLCIRMPRPDGYEDAASYTNRTDARFDARNSTLEGSTVIPWLDGLDVVFTIETPYDWRVPGWCHRAGAKLVVQGNPEFVRHMRPDFATLQHPDQWWWPTSWRTEHLPPGIHMPVPMDRHPVTRSDDGRLHILHTIGKRAFADRNGTEILVQAMRMVHSEVKLTVHSIDGDVIPFQRKRNVELVINHNPVTDLWSQYEDQDVLILPRRYGGLSLPALEATAAGMVVAMPNCSPNTELAAVLMPVHRSVSLKVASGTIQSWDANAALVADTIDNLASLGRDGLQSFRDAQANLLPTWEQWRPRYMQAFEDLCES